MADFNSEQAASLIRNFAESTAMNSDYAEAGMLLRAAGLIAYGRFDDALGICERADRTASGKFRSGTRSYIAGSASAVRKLIAAEAAS